MHAEHGPTKISPLIIALSLQIVEMIRREGYEVGHKLNGLALSEKLGVSRPPIRRALLYLESLGIVTSTLNKGFQLAKASNEALDLASHSNKPTEEELYLQIANDRIGGYLPAEIVEADLMSRYNIHRPQVQRILNRMSRESMIDRKPGRGWIFRPLLSTAESHRESYRFRMIIEPSAVLEPGYQPDFDELEKCRKEQVDMLNGGIERFTSAELYRVGVHLHETVIAGAKNSFLLDSLKSLNQMRRVVEYGTHLERARLHRQCEEHLVLIDLLVSGERMEASLFLRQHLNTARITKTGDTR
jgi:DNA-binding GntR family transcriptional regulator